MGRLIADARGAIDHRARRGQEAAIDAWHRSDPGPAPGTGPRTLIACGALDQVISPENTALLAQRWAATMPITYEGCGHALMAQVPVDLAAHLAAHLS